MANPILRCSALAWAWFAIGCAPPPAVPAPALPTPALAAPPEHVLVEAIATTPAKPEPPPPAKPSLDPVAAAVAAEDRAPDDLALDAQRKPLELLRFFGITPGQHVAELGAGGGYTTELLARVVGNTGKVYGQNSKFILERFAEQPWSTRLQKPVMSNTLRLDTPFDAPFPEQVSALDTVLLVLFYHDTVWQGVDRERMNAAIYKALKAGGTYGIVDHSAREGDGLTQVETLHRIEEKLVIAEIEKAGFMLVGSAGFLKNPDDRRDWNASPRSAGELRGTSDRFVLKFQKPMPQQP